MSFETQRAYVDKALAQLSIWDASLSGVKSKMSKKSADVRIGYYEGMQNWTNKQRVFKNKINDIKSSGMELEDNTLNEAQTLWDEIEELVSTLGRRK